MLVRVYLAVLSTYVILDTAHTQDPTCTPTKYSQVQPSDIKFQLHTRNYPDVDYPELVIPGDNFNTLKNYKYFDTNLPCQVTIHGWQSQPTDEFNQKLVRAKLKREEANCIVVDLSKPVDDNYLNAVQHVEDIGNIIGNFIIYLIDIGVYQENIHVIGFSLGTQIAGFVGKKTQLEYVKLPLITALDPAGPCFLKTHSKKLQKSDANFVKVIHTSYIKGLFTPCGHVDIYPNGGRVQEGCGFDFDGGCSHFRAVQFYEEAMDNGLKFKCCRENSFQEFLLKKRCSDYVFMADNFFKYSGKFYLQTNNQFPYSRY